MRAASVPAESISATIDRSSLLLRSARRTLSDCPRRCTGTAEDVEDDDEADVDEVDVVDDDGAGGEATGAAGVAAAGAGAADRVCETSVAGGDNTEAEKAAPSTEACGT